MLIAIIDWCYWYRTTNSNI